MWKNRAAVVAGVALASIGLLVPAAQAASPAGGSDKAGAVVTEESTTPVQDSGGLKCWQHRQKWTGKLSGSKVSWWLTVGWCAENGKIVQLSHPRPELPKLALERKGLYAYSWGGSGKAGWVYAGEASYKNIASDTEARYAQKVAFLWGYLNVNPQYKCGQLRVRADGTVTSSKECGVGKLD